MTSGVQIDEVYIAGQQFFAITVDGEYYLQRTEIKTASDTPLQPYEKVLIHICRYMVKDDLDN